MMITNSPTVALLSSPPSISRPRPFTPTQAPQQSRTPISTSRKSSRPAHILAAVSSRSAVHVNSLRNIDWPEALLFDCDGVLVDTEAEGHRVAFNEAFARKNLAHEWGLEQYGELLEVGGGKERMNAYFTSKESTAPWAVIKDPAERKAFLKELHELKTDIFNELIETGRLPVRPGVSRLISELNNCYLLK